MKSLGSQSKAAAALGVAVSSLNDYIRRPGKEHLKEAAKRKPPTPAVFGVGPQVDIDVERIRRIAAERFRAKHNHATRKDAQRISFPHGPVCIVFAGDQHIGNAGTDVERMFGEQEIIGDTPGAYVWQMGDVVDNFIVGKLQTENFKESLDILSQWELAKHYLAGFGEKIVAYCGGNHEAWSGMLTGVDQRRKICPEHALYDGDEISATVEVGERKFKIRTRHKWRGSSQYNATHQLERAARFDTPDFDLYVGAHLHTGSLYREFTLNGQRKAAIQTGAYKVHDDYAKSSGFPSSDHSTACAVVLHESGAFFGCSNLSAIKQYMEAVYTHEATP